nr:GH13755p [Drosophila melanogaster]
MAIEPISAVPSLLSDYLRTPSCPPNLQWDPTVKICLPNLDYNQYVPKGLLNNPSLPGSP